MEKLQKTGEITAALNVRMGPSKATKSVGVLARGSKVVVTGKDSKTGWYRITYKGASRYISNQYTKITSTAKATAKKPAETAGNNAKVQTAYNKTASGLTYSIIDGGVNWKKPVGKMTFLDGDFWSRGYSGSVSENPKGAKTTAMAKVAAKRNMILVIPKIPDYTRGYGYTWWVKSANNAKKLKKLDSYLSSKIGSSKKNSWYMGYSGGAEYITYELARRGQGSYGNGGAIILAGGGSPRQMTGASSTFKSRFDMHWIVGSKDGTGQSSNARTWSAFEASKKGQAFYKKKGFKTTRTVLKGQDHHSYNLAKVMDIGLKKAGL